MFSHIQNLVWPSHIHNLAIVLALACLEPEACSKHFETLTRHIQKPDIEQFNQALFYHILSYSELSVTVTYAETWHIGILEYSEALIINLDTYSEPCNVYRNKQILRNPGSSESLYIGNDSVFGTLTHLKPDIYSKPCQRFKIQCFAKIVKSYNHFSKVLYLRSLTEF